MYLRPQPPGAGRNVASRDCSLVLHWALLVSSLAGCGLESESEGSLQLLLLDRQPPEGMLASGDADSAPNLTDDTFDEPDPDVIFEFPVARIDLPNGNVLSFYASPIDGGQGVIEHGASGSQALLNGSVLELATPLEIFLAVTNEDVPVPEAMLDPQVVEVSNAADRGWLLSALETSVSSLEDGTGGDGNPGGDGDGLLLAPSWCDSWLAFGFEFCDPASPYQHFWCKYNQSDYQNDTRKVYNYRGGQCTLSGSHQATLRYWALSNSCSATGSQVVVWSETMYAGGWFHYTWIGANRQWNHYRYGSGLGHIGHKWAPATCL